MEPRIESARSKDGTAISWYDFGGSGPDLVLGHATGFCGRMWAPVVAYLQDEFRCIAYDVRGHGLSGRPAYGIDGWDWSHFAEDLDTVLQASSVVTPFGVGHSSGGATELLVEQAAPGTFSALYLFEPVIFANDPPLGPMPERELAVRTRKRRDSFASPDEALTTFATKGPFSKLHPDALQAYVEFGWARQPDGSVTLRCRPDDEADVYVMASTHDGYSRLSSIACSVLVAHGEASTSFSADEMSHVAGRIPQGRFESVPAVGHFGPLEDPRDFASRVKAAFSSK